MELLCQSSLLVSESDWTD